MIFCTSRCVLCGVNDESEISFLSTFLCLDRPALLFYLLITLAAKSVSRVSCHSTLISFSCNDLPDFWDVTLVFLWTKTTLTFTHITGVILSALVLHHLSFHFLAIVRFSFTFTFIMSVFLTLQHNAFIAHLSFWVNSL